MRLQINVATPSCLLSKLDEHKGSNITLHVALQPTSSRRSEVCLQAIDLVLLGSNFTIYIRKENPNYGVFVLLTMERYRYIYEAKNNLILAFQLYFDSQ